MKAERRRCRGRLHAPPLLLFSLLSTLVMEGVLPNRQCCSRVLGTHGPQRQCCDPAPQRRGSKCPFPSSPPCIRRVYARARAALSCCHGMPPPPAAAVQVHRRRPVDDADWQARGAGGRRALAPPPFALLPPPPTPAPYSYPPLCGRTPPATQTMRFS